MSNYDSILNHKLISESYFFPNDRTPRDIFWIDTGHAKLACHYYQCPGATKTIIHWHGNGEVVANYVGSPLYDLECNILFAEYRGYGASSGIPTLTGLLEDIPAIVASVDDALEDIIFFGRSVGSIYALEAARLFPNAGGLIIESGIANVLPRVLMRVQPEEVDSTDDEFELECKKYFDNQSKIHGFNGKVLIMHTR